MKTLFYVLYICRWHIQVRNPLLLYTLILFEFSLNSNRCTQIDRFIYIKPFCCLNGIFSVFRDLCVLRGSGVCVYVYYVYICMHIIFIRGNKIFFRRIIMSINCVNDIIHTHKHAYVYVYVYCVCVFISGTGTAQIHILQGKYKSCRMYTRARTPPPPPPPRRPVYPALCSACIKFITAAAADDRATEHTGWRISTAIQRRRRHRRAHSSRARDVRGLLHARPGRRRRRRRRFVSGLLRTNIDVWQRTSI